MIKDSIIKEYILKYIELRRASGIIGKSGENSLIYFNNHCSKYGPTAKLSDEIVSAWCNKRYTETPKSRNGRICSVVSFLRYSNKRGWTDVKIPELYREVRSTYIPHPFTFDELKAFFHEIDNRGNTRKAIPDILCSLELPIVFRLLYSTGMRTIEVRELKCNDVDLNEGVISICKSKSIDQHRIALHDSMKCLLQEYERIVSRIMPNRTVFFPDRMDKVHDPEWISRHFTIAWRKISKEDARAYDLRSNYAVTNINRWGNLDMGWFDRFVYLSRTMGHRHLASTSYYYNLVPIFADVIKDRTEKFMNELLPDIKQVIDYEDK